MRKHTCEVQPYLSSNKCIMFMLFRHFYMLGYLLQNLRTSETYWRKMWFTLLIEETCNFLGCITQINSCHCIKYIWKTLRLSSQCISLLLLQLQSLVHLSGGIITSNLPQWSAVVRKILLMQPSSAAAEKCFFTVEGRVH